MEGGRGVKERRGGEGVGKGGKGRKGDRRADGRHVFEHSHSARKANRLWL